MFVVVVIVVSLCCSACNHPTTHHQHTSAPLTGVVVLKRVGTGDQVADILTKPLAKTLFVKHSDALSMRCTTVVIPKQ